MVFNRFWRADPARARTSGGTGLGLSISLEDTHLHGGWLQAWGRPGEGAQFRLTLPAPGRRRAAPEPAAAGARRRRGAGRMSAPSRPAPGVPPPPSLACLTVVALAGCVRLPESGPGRRDRVRGQPSTSRRPSSSTPSRPSRASSPDRDRQRLPRGDDGHPAVRPTSPGSSSPATPTPRGTRRRRRSPTPRRPQPRGTDPLTVRLTGANRLDSRGSFRGPLPRRPADARRSR